MRDKECEPQQFRRLMRSTGLLLCADAVRNLKPAVGDKLDQRKYVILPVLRAGLVFGEAFEELLPQAFVGHLGIGRIGTGLNQKVHRYLVSLPTGEFSHFFVLDPIIATGETMCSAVSALTELGVPPEFIRVASLVVSTQGVKRFYENPAHKKICIYAVACDEKLDADGKVVPGLGNVGNRLFGTGEVLQ